MPEQRSLRWFIACVAVAAVSLATTRWMGRMLSGRKAAPPPPLFSRQNLVAWCIVPFDSARREPEERAAMLERLGFKRFAYDWRAEDQPTFDAEMEALKRHGITLQAFWLGPGEVGGNSRHILDVLKHHGIKTELWAVLALGADRVEGAEQQRRVEAAVAKLGPLAEQAKRAGCTVSLYNHGGWFGEPENQVAIVQALNRKGITNVGIVYNLHHGHAHVDRLGPLLALMKPYLLAVNLNGTARDGDKAGQKILPLGQGAMDLDLLRTIRDSGYRGPIGILGHTMDDAELRLKDNLDGLDWLVPQLDGKPAGPTPRPRTAVPPPTTLAGASSTPDGRVPAMIAEARASGDATRGAEVFADARFGCLTCHRVGPQGGTIGPDLTTAGVCLTPEHIVESVLWPRRQVKEGYSASILEVNRGELLQGYIQQEADRFIDLRNAATGQLQRISKEAILEVRELGTLMPEGLADAMTTRQRNDLFRFLLELGRPGGVTADAINPHAHSPTAFTYDREPLRPDLWPNRTLPINRERLYDFYAKEAEFFAKQETTAPLLPPFPGLDGGASGHWGNQNELLWTDSRWNEADLGTVVGGVFRGAGVTVPKGVCIRLGDRGEMAACFNPETLRYEALWRGGFVRFSDHRHGFLDGLALAGTPLPRPEGKTPDRPFVYHGFYRHGRRVLFSYRLGDVELLDAPWVEGDRFTRVVAPAAGHPLAHLTRGGPSQWPQVLETRGTLGTTRPYAVDTIEPPFENPWKALLFFGDHDFNPDGSAVLCTMHGDVWRVDGLDGALAGPRWRRVASGLHHALGLVVADGRAHVLGRDQITRLHDLNGDGEADFYECVSNAYETSPAGHDFIAGLQRGPEGDFYTASGKQGLLRIGRDGRTVEVVATGFRNPDGVGLSPDGVLTVPSSEGEWVPASMVCEVRPGGYYGYGGPKSGKAPDLPLVYLPRGLDNSSGGQVTVPDDRWGPLKGRMVHFSFGMGTLFLVLREQVDGQPQGAVVPLPGDFLSGVHRGRFNPRDGQLYVSGMAGWSTYTSADGCFQRVRYTGAPVQLPVAFGARLNGVLVTFSRPVDPAVASTARGHFAQAWNYRYGPGYGSQELSPRHPGTPGHDPLAVRSATVLDDGRTLFLEIPELQPVNQLHLHLRVDSGPAHDLFATVHKLGPPFTGFAGYRPSSKVIAAHPILSDLAVATKPTPNPWRKPLPDARTIVLEAGKNLTFTTPVLRVRPNEPIRLVLINPDVVPHNWALIRPGTLPKVGELVDRFVADPEAVARHYVPRTDDVLVYTDIVGPQDQFIIHFRAPAEKGHYPFLCTFPGHWRIMNGVMIVW